MKKLTPIFILILIVISGIIYYFDPGVNELKYVEEPVVEETVATTTPAFSTIYISTVDWPPVTRTESQTYSCTVAGETGTTTITGVEWCRTVITEGAAGSTYLQYSYATADAEMTRIVTFTLRQSQCENYDEPARTECLTERANFNPDDIIAAL